MTTDSVLSEERQQALSLPAILFPATGCGRALRLLAKVAEQGSINKAAQALGLSYKTAWEEIDTLNNLADRPLVARATGGRGGGGTMLTPAGERFLQQGLMIAREYDRFLAFLSEDGDSALKNYRVLRRMEMKLSARNIWSGTIEKVERGPVNARVGVVLKGGDRVRAIITNQSLEQLGLVEGGQVLAIVKASSVSMGNALHIHSSSSGNLLFGRICRISQEEGDCEVTLTLPGDSTVTATMRRDGRDALGLRLGDEACALIKESQILLAVA